MKVQQAKSVRFWLNYGKPAIQHYINHVVYAELRSMSSSGIADNVNADSLITDRTLLNKIDLDTHYENCGYISTEDIPYPPEHFEISHNNENFENCTNSQKSLPLVDISCVLFALHKTSDHDEVSTNSSISVYNTLAIDEHNRNNLNSFFFGNASQIDTEIENVPVVTSVNGLPNIPEESCQTCVSVVTSANGLPNIPEESYQTHETLIKNKPLSISVPSCTEGANISQNETREPSQCRHLDNYSPSHHSSHSIQTSEQMSHAQISQSSCHVLNATQPSNVVLTSYENTVHADMVPDLLNSHAASSYLTFPSTQPHLMRHQSRMHSSNQNFFRPPFFHPVFSSRNARRVARNRIPEESHKSCCGMIMNQTISIRWFILMIAFVGLCCVVVGVVLGALKGSTGVNSDDHITVALLMIGVGIVLITVSGVAWRLTSHDAPTCCTMLGVSSDPAPEVSHRFRPRIHNHHNRSQHPFGAMLYPEFQYCPPPPSYQASMQDYRLRLLLLDNRPQPISSPPPTYRSTSSPQRATIPIAESQHNPSLPPSYRSRASMSRTRPTLDTMGFSNTPSGNVGHSRNPSLTLSHLSHDSMFLGSAHSCLLGDNTTTVAQNVTERITNENGNTGVDKITSIELPNNPEITILSTIPTISEVVGVEISARENLSAGIFGDQNERLEYL